MNKTISVEIAGGDEVSVTYHVENDKIIRSQWSVVGRLELYEEVKKLKTLFVGDYRQIPIPTGTHPEQLLLKKLVLKVRDEWGEQPSDPELCHCRKVPQINVERAIILGAHTIEKVRLRTSANTGCGTCLPDINDLLKKYLE